jgi:hypothetical protein
MNIKTAKLVLFYESLVFSFCCLLAYVKEKDNMTIMNF